jgi:hypothetical protein
MLAAAASGKVCPTKQVAVAFAKACRADQAEQREVEELWEKASIAAISASSQQAKQGSRRRDVTKASQAMRRMHGEQEAEPPDAPQLHPTIGGTPAQFVRELRALRACTGKPGPKEILQRTGKRLPSTTMYDALKPGRERLPSLEVTEIIVTACAPRAVKEWVTAWQTVTMAEFVRDNPA